jgi:hypothetical protein
MKMLLLLSIIWQLGMTMKQAQAKCPTKLLSLYEKLHGGQYVACDDGKKTTVLIFSQDKLVAIMDLKFFAQWEGQ